MKFWKNIKIEMRTGISIGMGMEMKTDKTRVEMKIWV